MFDLFPSCPSLLYPLRGVYRYIRVRVRERLIAVPVRMGCTGLGFGTRVVGTSLVQRPRPDYHV